MSRIDEALKRASHGPLVGRIPTKGTDAPVRLGDEFTLGDYPLEGRNGNVPGESTSVHPEPAIPPRVQVRPSVAYVSPDVRQKGKLVVATDNNAIFVEQYRRLAATLHDAQLEKG